MLGLVNLDIALSEPKLVALPGNSFATSIVKFEK